jgi:tetratricopeptide (TPR) repeat protein
VNTLKGLMLALLVGTTLAGLAACESTRETDGEPGALPRRKPSSSPRLTAATYVAHAELLERRGELERAAAQYRQALELSPDLVTARNRLGIVLNKLGRHAEASAEFRQALTKSPQNAQLWNNLGFSLCLERNYEDAEAALARAVELQPGFRRARMNHAVALARLERYDEALAEFAQAGTLADAHYNVAVLQADAGHYAAAARSLELALQHDPNLDGAREQLREISRLAAAEEAAAQAAAMAAAQQVEPLQAEESSAIASADEASDNPTDAPVSEAQQASRPEDPGKTPPCRTVESSSPQPAPRSPAIAFPTDYAGYKDPWEAQTNFALAADVTLQEMPASPSELPVALIDEVRFAQLWRQAGALLDGAADPDSLPAITPALEGMRVSELRALLTDLLDAMATHAPWAEQCITYLEELLGLSPE